MTSKQTENEKTKRPRQSPVLPPEPAIHEMGDIVYLHDPMSGCRTIMLMKNLMLFLIQEGYFSASAVALAS